MRDEVSSGIVVFRDQEGSRLYLLLDRKEGFLDFPKGHIEKGESETDAAVRETHEETGLNVQPIEGFRKEIEYWFKLKGELIHKKVVMFTGQAGNQHSPKVSFEHEGYRWLSYGDAMDQLRFSNQKDLLIEVQNFLESRKTGQ